MGVLTGCRLAKATAVAGFLAATAACADVNTDANALFVRAVQAWTAAAALPADDPGKADERIALLRQVNANLDQIINELPGSDIAVRLITGETLGPITLDGARDALVQISAAASGLDCATSPTPACLVQAAQSDLAKIDEPGLFFAVPDVLAMMVLANDVGGIQALVVAYPDLLQAAPYQGSFAQTYARTGQDGAAFGLVNAALPADQSIILAGIAKGQAEVGRLSDAATTAAQITDPLQKLLALTSAQEFDAALALTVAVQADDTPRAFADIAIAMAQVGQIERAITTLDLVLDSTYRREPIREIAIAQARAGQVAQAIETAAKLPDGDTFMLLRLWHITPDPRILAKLQERFDRTPPDSNSRRLILTIMSLVDPKPEYTAELEAIISQAINEQSRPALLDYDIFILTAAGRFTDAATLAINWSSIDVLSAMKRIQALRGIAQALAVSPQSP